MNAFSIWVGLGAMVGLWRVWQNAPQRQAGTWVNAGLFILFFTLVGARLFYVGMNWPYFNTHLAEGVMLWLGGLTWTGAAAGAGLSVIFLAFQYRASRYRLSPQTAHLPLGSLGDRLYPLLPPLAITIWLGCWQTGIAYGAPLSVGTFGGIPTLDESSAISLRFPLQPLAAITLLAFFAFLETRAKLSYSTGRLSGLAVAGLLLHTIAASLLRVDPSPYWNGLRVDTWLGMFYLIFFITLVIINNLVQRTHRKNPFSNPERSSS